MQFLKSLFEKPTDSVSDPLVPFKIDVTQAGTGAMCKKGEKIECNYTGKLLNGTVFDSSLNPGRSPFEFNLGVGQVIKCWDKGFLELERGQKAILNCPPEMAYGASGAGGVIGPNATLRFDVELVDF